MFVGKTKSLSEWITYQVIHTREGTLVLLSWKCLPGTNTLAYDATSVFLLVIVFIVLTHVYAQIKYLTIQFIKGDFKWIFIASCDAE
jgi:hypothetical protein